MISCRRLICMEKTIKMQHMTLKIGMHSTTTEVLIEMLVQQEQERKRRRKRIDPRSIQRHLHQHPCSQTSINQSHKAIGTRQIPKARILRTGAFLKIRWREPQAPSRPQTKTTLSRRTHKPIKKQVETCQRALLASISKDLAAQSVHRRNQFNQLVSWLTMSKLAARQAK